jgi:hypothetical protein
MPKLNKIFTYSLFITTLSILLLHLFKINEYFNNYIEIQTVTGSSNQINNIMKDINSVGNQMLANAEYDTVDQRILNSRKKS